MKAGGTLLVVLGVLVLAQVLAGDALGRLGIAGGSQPAEPKDSDLVPPTQGTHDAQGRRL